MSGFNLLQGSLGVEVRNHSLTPDEWADRITAKLIHVAETTAPPIRDQALAYKDQMRSVIRTYIDQIIKETRAEFRMK